MERSPMLGEQAPWSSAWCHPRGPRASLGLSRAVGTPARPWGSSGELQPHCCVPPSAGRVRASPWPRRGCRPPRPHGLLYPHRRPSPLGQCELESQHHSLWLGSPAQFSPVCTGARGVPAPPLTPRQPRVCCSARPPWARADLHLHPWLLQASAALCLLVLEVMGPVVVGRRSPTSGAKQQRVLHAQRGREKEHSGDAPGVGDAAWGGGVYTWPGTLVHSTLSLGTKCQN